jgi:hypothetical protein
VQQIPLFIDLDAYCFEHRLARSLNKFLRHADYKLWIILDSGFHAYTGRPGICTTSPKGVRRSGTIDHMHTYSAQVCHALALVSPYTHHYRRGLIGLLEALEFGSTNTAHAPVMQALDLIKRYK